MRIGVVAILAVAVLASSPAGATVLTPGSSGLLTENFGVIGSGPADSNVLAFSNGSFLSASSAGLLATAVVSDPTNSFCSGCLDFIYQVGVGAGPEGASGIVSRISGFDFAGFQTDVGIATSAPPNLTSTGAIAPGSIDRSGNPGDTVGFNFADSLLPGTLSDVLVIKTDALAFKGGTLTIDGTNIAAFEPVADDRDPVPAPEPASLMVLASALVGLCLIWRRTGKPYWDGIAPGIVDPTTG